MKKEKLINDIFQGLLMAAAIAVAIPAPELAWAQNATNIGDSVSQLNTQLVSMPTLISIIFYVAGAALAGAGLMKLKAHAENPGQTPLAQGIGRLAVGGGLLALPLVTSNIINSMGLGSGTQGTKFQAFGTITP